MAERLVNDLERWLRSLGLGRYAAVFRAHDVDARTLATLTERDLTLMGVEVDVRRRLLVALAAEYTEAVAAPAERRQLTVLACNLVGATGLASGLDPEDMAPVMRAFLATCTEVIEAWDGHVGQTMADGMLAYFGYPRARETAAERAVHAGFELVRAVERLTPRPGVRLSARVGIETGLVVIGDPTGAGAGAAVGEAPQRAGRLQGLAAAGTVAIGETTRGLVGRLFQLIDLGPQRVHGVAEPLGVWQLLGPSPVEDRFQARHGGDLRPLVGREAETELLLGAFDAAASGHGRVVLIEGVPGIGKSRLLSHLRQRLQGRAYTPQSLYCSPFARNSALYPAVRWLERAAAIGPDDPPARQLERLQASLAPTTADVGATTALLARVLGIATGERHPDLELEPGRLQQRTLEALAEQLTGRAGAAPVLMVFEDVHWMDPTTRKLLTQVVQRAPSRPMLVVVTARWGLDPAWRDQPHVTGLRLPRLNDDDSRALVDIVTGGKPLPTPLRDQIVSDGDGVPLFLEQLTKAALASGGLDDRGTHYELTSTPPPRAVPATLQDSLMARLDRLGSAKALAQVAAVIGREFSERLLAEVAGGDAAAFRLALDRLIEADILVRHRDHAEARFGFSHALFQEAAYESLLKSRRRTLHARVTDVLASSFPSLIARRPEAIAHHAEQAGRDQEALRHWQQAADEALARGASAEAIEHLRHGLALVGRLSSGGERTATELELQLTLGRALVAVEGYAAIGTGHAYDRARVLCARLGPTPRLFPILWGLASNRVMRAELDEALRIVRGFRRLAVRDGSRSAVQVAERLLGSTRFWLGQPHAARAPIEQALALYDPDAHSDLALDYSVDPRVAACCHLSLTLFVLGDVERASAESHGAVTLSGRLGQAYGRGHALKFACLLALVRRDPIAVATPATALSQLAAEHGYGMFAAISQLCHGWARAARGRAQDQVEAGIAQLVQGLGAYQATGARLLVPLFLSLLAELQSEAGQADEARQHAYDALDQVERTGERWLEAELHRLIASLILAESRGKDRFAEPHLQKAIQIARGQQARTWELRATLDLARLRLTQGRPSDARVLLAPICRQFPDDLALPELVRARSLLRSTDSDTSARAAMSSDHRSMPSPRQ